MGISLCNQSSISTSNQADLSNQGVNEFNPIDVKKVASNNTLGTGVGARFGRTHVIIDESTNIETGQYKNINSVAYTDITTNLLINLKDYDTDEDLKNHLKRRHTDQKTSTKELLKPIQYKKTFTETHSILSSHNSLQESTDNNNLSTTGIDDTFSKTTSTFGFSSSTGFKKEINIITKELLGIGTKYEFEDNIREVRVNINICR